MVRIAINQRAFDAIVGMLPSNVGFENKRAEMYLSMRTWLREGGTIPKGLKSQPPQGARA